MKNKFKKLTGFFFAAVMTLVALPIQTFASEWGVGDNVYAAMLGNYIGSDGGRTVQHIMSRSLKHLSTTQSIQMFIR